MSVIALEGMKFFANHGVYDEEKILGGEYLVDVFIETDTDEAAEEDDLDKTVNYELVYTICEIEMRNRSLLIETVMNGIKDRLKQNFKQMQQLTIKVSKLNPPLGGRVKAASIETTYDFSDECGRCKKGIVCYNDENCWCKEDKIIHSRTAELVKQEHGNCLCQKCINFYTG